MEKQEAATKNNFKIQEAAIKRCEASIKALEVTAKKHEASIKELEFSIKALEASMKSNFERIEKSLTIRLGGLLFLGITALAALITIL